MKVHLASASQVALSAVLELHQVVRAPLALTAQEKGTASMYVPQLVLAPVQPVLLASYWEQLANPQAAATLSHLVELVVQSAVERALHLSVQVVEAVVNVQEVLAAQVAEVVKAAQSEAVSARTEPQATKRVNKTSLFIFVKDFLN